ncbi:MAG: hypothetical protein Q9191_008092, partial [Dirinaria sp. TL-2023a]
RPQSQSSLAPRPQHSVSATGSAHHLPQPSVDCRTESASPLKHIPRKQQSPCSVPRSPPAASSFATPPTAPPPPAADFEPRSPFSRRPPASRSSHGIETYSGPPPALSTQLSPSTEQTWKNGSLGGFARLGSRAKTTESLGVSIHGGLPLSNSSMVIDPIKGPPPNDQSPRRILPIMNTGRMAQDNDTADSYQGDETLKGSQFPKLPFAMSPKTRPGAGRAPSSPREDLFHQLAHDPAANETPEGISPKTRRSVRSRLIALCKCTS